MHGLNTGVLAVVGGTCRDDWKLGGVYPVFSLFKTMDEKHMKVQSIPTRSFDFAEYRSAQD